jgi:hypothetical protein
MSRVVWRNLRTGKLTAFLCAHGWLGTIHELIRQPMTLLRPPIPVQGVPTFGVAREAHL